jgi:hypothetical protein
LIVGLGTVGVAPVLVDPVVDPGLTALAFVALDWTTPAPHPANAEADASISGKYHLRFRACVHVALFTVISVCCDANLNLAEIGIGE